MDEYTYVVNVEGAVVRDGEYLLIERAPGEDHAPGTVAFPGGKVEESAGDTRPIESTVRRELDEELGISVGAVDYVTSSVFEADTGTEVINVVTHCEDVGDIPAVCDPEEVRDFLWLSPPGIADHANAPPFLSGYVDAVEAYRRNSPSVE